MCTLYVRNEKNADEKRKNLFPRNGTYMRNCTRLSFVGGPVVRECVVRGVRRCRRGPPVVLGGLRSVLGACMPALHHRGPGPGTRAAQTARKTTIIGYCYSILLMLIRFHTTVRVRPPPPAPAPARFSPRGRAAAGAACFLFFSSPSHTSPPVRACRTADHILPPP